MIEIERRYLLKCVPEEVYGSSIILKILQHYVPDGPRLRASYLLGNPNNIEYVKCFKRSISEMSNEENEETLTKKEYFQHLVKAKRFLAKTRYKVNVGDLVWEIDEMSDPLMLVIAEVELPNEDTEFELPDFIKNNMIMEITGMKQFTNHNLANPIELGHLVWNEETQTIE